MHPRPKRKGRESKKIIEKRPKLKRCALCKSRKVKCLHIREIVEGSEDDFAPGYNSITYDPVYGYELVD